MARLDGRGISSILSAAKTWRSRCLEQTGSVFTDRQLWNAENFNTLDKAFLGNPIFDKDRKFYDKLQEQLTPYPPAVSQLAAELTWLMMLFPSGISGNKKREDIQQIWSWSGEELPATHPLLGDLLDRGIGRAGTAFNVLRWKEFGCLITLFTAWCRLARDKQMQLLSNAWEFAGWTDELIREPRRSMRHMLLYLLFPDSFEPIAINRHRRQIVAYFGSEAGLPTSLQEARNLSRLELDRRILQIRRHLESQYPGLELDFYRPPLSNLLPLMVKRAAKIRGQTRGADELPAGDAVTRVVSGFSGDRQTQDVALRVLAAAIQCAHHIAPMRWAVTVNQYRVKLNVGRLVVVEMRRGRMRLATMARKLAHADDPKVAALMQSLKYKAVPAVSGYRLYTVPAGVVNEAIPAIQPGLGDAIQAAAQTSRRPAGLKAHSSAALEHLESRLGTSLPRPAHQTSGPIDSLEAVAVTTPLSGFRATELDLNTLISDIEVGDIGLPDIQRPFVWTPTKVRDLFDSMYRGYPVGYLLFWAATAEQQATRVIGINDKSFKSAKRLIVDGQQRLTSLYAVMRGATVLDEDYRPTKIEIAFRPRDGRFEVADAAIRRDPEFIANISDYLSDARGSYALIHEFLSNLASKRTLSDQDRQIIGQNLDRLFGLKRYRFSVLEISAELPEEAVADIFVRINSEGVKLNQADFILTLLSVIWEDGRKQLEAFARDAQRPPDRPSRPTPFNHLIQPSADQLLRVSVAVALNRARLKSVYQLLRGKDPDTGSLVAERRRENLEALQTAQEHVLNLDNWHRFIACITASGYRLAEQVVSHNALLIAYALYLRGLIDKSVPAPQLDRLIGRWFAMSILTSRYSGSPETVMEQDLASVAGARDANEFVDTLKRTIDAVLTSDYWTVTLPLELETSSIRAPAWVAFVAAQLQLDAPVLFSDKKLWALLDPLTRGKKRPFEAHHLFPKAWLAGQGISERRDFNQVGNLALLEWPANLKAGSRSPAAYVPDLKKHLSEASWERMCRLHALPPNWADMAYEDFLSARRLLMAEMIRRGFDSLSGSDEIAVERDEGGSDLENAVWRDIRELEKSLRVGIRRRLDDQWGQKADDRIRDVLGPETFAVVERNREKSSRQYKLTSNHEKSRDLLDYLYLGQLIQIMKSNDVWQLFHDRFRDKRQLEDLADAIIPVRNDAAHFRSVPARELDRCRVAVGDLQGLMKI